MKEIIFFINNLYFFIIKILKFVLLINKYKDLFTENNLIYFLFGTKFILCE